MAAVEIDVDGDEWTVDGNVMIRGDVFADGEYVGSDPDLFDGVTDHTSFRERLETLHGQFAVVVDTPGAVHAAVDHIASIPLYYGVGEGRAYVSDDTAWIHEQTNGTCDPTASTEFLLTGYVTGNDTLYPPVKQVQAGQTLSIDRDRPGELTLGQHFSFTDPEVVPGDRLVVLDRLDTALKNAFRRLAERAGGEPVLIALSGGYDSRLVALLLDLIGYENVYAFTFPDFLTEGDVEIAREFASALGIEWAPVDVTGEEFRAFARSEEYAGIERTLDDFASVTPFLFWTFVLKKVNESESLPDSGVVVTGHSVAHSTDHLPHVDDDTPAAAVDTVVEWVWSHQYNMRHLDDRETKATMRDRIRDRLPPVTDGDATAVKNAVIDWYWRERLPKFLVRHVDAYGYWGYDRWLPLWDRELAEVWGSIPFDYRRDKDIYEEYIDRVTAERLGEPYPIAGEGGSNTSSTVDPISVFESVVSRLPVETAVRNLFRRWQTRQIKQSSRYRRYEFLSEEQFERLHPQARHAKYFHALKKVSRLGCYPPEGTPLYEDVRLYESHQPSR